MTMMMYVIAVAMATGPGNGGEKLTPDQAEIQRLQRVVIEKTREAQALKKRVRSLNREIDDLSEKLAECEMDRSDAGARSTRERDAEAIAELCRLICSSGENRPEGRDFLASIADMLRDWTRGNLEREELFGPGISILETNVVMIDRAREEQKRKEEAANERRKTLPRRALKDASLLCDIVQEFDALSSALAFLGMVGESVEWEGTVTGGIDSASAPYQVEVTCGNVLVFCEVRDKRPGSLRGIRLKAKVKITGRISDIGDTVGYCKSALVSDCAIVRKGKNGRR